MNLEHWAPRLFRKGQSPSKFIIQFCMYYKEIRKTSISPRVCFRCVRYLYRYSSTNTGCALCSLDVWVMWEKQNISCQPSTQLPPAFIILITKQNIFEITISPTQQAAMQWRWAHSDNWGVCAATTEYIWRNNIWYWLWHHALQCWHQYILITLLREGSY